MEQRKCEHCGADLSRNQNHDQGCPTRTISFTTETIQAIKTVSGHLLPDMDDEGARDPEIMAEVTLDAGRLSFNGFKEADEEIKQLIDKHGWDRVLQEVTKHVYTA